MLSLKAQPKRRKTKKVAGGFQNNLNSYIISLPPILAKETVGECVSKTKKLGCTRKIVKAYTVRFNSFYTRWFNKWHRPKGQLPRHSR